MEQKDYAVTIRSSYTKTIHVKADSLVNAEREAHALFAAVHKLRRPEKFEEKTVSVKWTGWDD
jgi:hypothetical protein